MYCEPSRNKTLAVWNEASAKNEGSLKFSAFLKGTLWAGKTMLELLLALRVLL